MDFKKHSLPGRQTNEGKADMDKWKEYINELKEVASGKRGWADASKTRAKDMNLQHGSLTVMAQVMGLKVVRHGKYGYIATK